MGTSALRPAAISYTQGDKLAGGREYVPGGTIDSTTVWEAGTPLVASSGKVIPATLDGTTNVVLSTGGKLVAFTGEKFEGKRFTSAVDGFAQKTVVGNPCARTVLVEANLYVDGAGGIPETITIGKMFATTHLKKLASSGIYVFDFSDATANAIPFIVVGFVDEVGTVNGRVLALISDAYYLGS